MTAEEIRGAVITAIGFITALIGWAGWLFVLWVLLLFVDFLTGSEAARMNGTWSSAKGKQGRQKKLGCFYMVLLSLVIDGIAWLMSDVAGIIHFPWDYRVIVLPMVLLWYILIDAGSIVENVALMGADVPEWLRKGIEKAQDAVDRQGEKITEALTDELDPSEKYESDEEETGE